MNCTNHKNAVILTVHHACTEDNNVFCVLLQDFQKRDVATLPRTTYGTLQMPFARRFFVLLSMGMHGGMWQGKNTHDI